MAVAIHHPHPTAEVFAIRGTSSFDWFRWSSRPDAVGNWLLENSKFRSVWSATKSLSSSLHFLEYLPKMGFQACQRIGGGTAAGGWLWPGRRWSLDRRVLGIWPEQRQQWRRRRRQWPGRTSTCRWQGWSVHVYPWGHSYTLRSPKYSLPIKLQARSPYLFKAGC